MYLGYLSNYTVLQVTHILRYLHTQVRDGEYLFHYIMLISLLIISSALTYDVSSEAFATGFINSTYPYFLCSNY